MQAGHGRPKLAVAKAPTTPEKPTIEPTERSMPAEQMTKVMPIASTPITEVDRTMLRELETDRKTGDRNAMTAVSAASTSSDSKRNAAAPKTRSRQESGRRSRRGLLTWATH